MARPRKNPAGSPMISLRMPIEMIEALKARGELTAQIVEAVRIYLDVTAARPGK